MNVACVEENLNEAATVLKAMSNPRRLRVMCSLCSGEKSVGELEQIIGISQSALSQHLAKLREDDLVKTRRQSQTIFYSLKHSAIPELLSCLNRLYTKAD